jgi:tetratricopeptide (TPR) repeat protein
MEHKKFIALLATVCVMFVIFIIKAFEYLPNKTVDGYKPNVNQQRQVVNQYQQQTFEENEKAVNQDEQMQNDERHKSGHIDFMPNEFKERPKRNDFEEIQAPKGAIEEEIPVANTSQQPSLTPEEIALKSIMTAEKFKVSSDYANALNELRKVPEVTNDNELVATSYEKTAEIYAVQKRFGTALSFAGKAYGKSPSAYREMLIARIYYQSGDTENAVSRMNNLLSRGFRD